MLKKFFLNPFFLFWAYYFIGPFLTINEILEINSYESVFVENDLIFKFIYHTIAYLTLLPFIIFISSKFHFPKYEWHSVKVSKFIYFFFSALVLIFSIVLLYYLYNNIPLIIGGDFKRAIAYIDFLESNRVITIIILLLIIIYLFLSKKFYNVLALTVVIFDFLMSRRTLMIFFIYPLIRNLKKFHLIYIFVFFTLFTVIRHRENISFDFSKSYAPFLSESYMIFLSNVEYENCLTDNKGITSYFDFERLNQSCRTLSYGAGGFSSRFNYNLIFGILSVLFFSIITIPLLSVLSMLINKRLNLLFSTILFVGIFIIFRDSLWNGFLFISKYTSILVIASIIYGSLLKKSLNKIS